MADENRLSKFSVEDATKALSDCTTTITGLRGKGDIDPGGKPWFFPDGIDLIDVQVSFGLTGVASFEVKVAGPNSAQAAALRLGPPDVSAPASWDIDVDDLKDHYVGDTDIIFWHNNRPPPHDVTVYFDSFYGCPLDSSHCPQFTVKAGTKSKTIVRSDACGPYPHHTEEASAKRKENAPIKGMPRIIIQ